jgi:hypothetical protein
MTTLPHGFSSATKLLLLATNLCVGAVNMVMEQKYSIAACNSLSTESSNYWDTCSQAEASLAFNNLFGPAGSVETTKTMAECEPIAPCIATQRVLHCTKFLAERHADGLINDKPIMLHTQQLISELRPVSQANLKSQILGRQEQKRYQINEGYIESLTHKLLDLDSKGDQSSYLEAYTAWITEQNEEYINNNMQAGEVPDSQLEYGDVYMKPGALTEAAAQKEIINITQIISEFLFLRYDAADCTKYSLAKRQLTRSEIYVDDYIFQGKWRPLAHEFTANAYMFNLVSGLCPSGKKVAPDSESILGAPIVRGPGSEAPWMRKTQAEARSNLEKQEDPAKQERL